MRERAMMPRMLRSTPASSSVLLGRTLTVSALTVCSALVACDFAGLAAIGDALIDPDAALLDRPGRKIADGVYGDLSIDGSAEAGPRVVARRLDGDADRVAIVPFLGGESCEIDSAYGYQRVSSRIDPNLDELPGLIAIQRTSVSPGRWSLMGFDCKSRFADLEDANVPAIVFPADTPRGLLAMANGDTIVLIDPKSGVTEIASGVRGAQVYGPRVYSIEGGQVVVRNDQFREVARVGTDVSRYVITGGADFELAFESPSGLSVWSEAGGEDHVQEDVCGTGVLGPDAVAYFSPCGERRLNVLTRGANVGLPDRVRLVGPSETIRLGHMEVSWGRGAEPSELVFTTSADASGTEGALNVARIEPAPEATDGVVTFTGALLADPVHLEYGIKYLDWNGQSGTLVTFERDPEDVPIGLITVAERVADLPGGSIQSARGILVDFDGSVGRLVLAEKSGGEYRLRELARRVPKQRQEVRPESSEIAFIADVENGRTGTLYLYDGDEPRAIAERVSIDTARYLVQPAGLAYMSDLGGAGELHAWLRDSELDLKIDEGVETYRTVPWPSAGILYSVVKGDDRGLYFSKAR